MTRGIDGLCFVVRGVPLPKGRPRLGRAGHVYTPATTEAWEKCVALHARAACAKARWVPGKRDCYSVHLRLRLPDGRRRDVDNCAKAVLDAMNGVVYLDDFQVGELSVQRVLRHASPGVIVTVLRIKEPT